MKNIASIIPCYAADTSGVCAALYELSGLIAVHDASGVNSTYATHDEPRWEEQPSMIYVSGLTELDAILGNDEKFIADVVSAAHDQQPAFIAVCGSPMPMMIGFDFDAAAREIERRSGIRTFSLHTNGMHAYSEGASEALLTVLAEYAEPDAEKQPHSVNILGAMPLDFGGSAPVQSLRTWLSETGFSVISCLAMGDGIPAFRRAAAASVNLVVSYSGLAAAQYCFDCFGTPYVCGVPVGAAFSAQLADALRNAERTGENAFPCAVRSDAAARTAVIGESIYAGSMAAALSVSGHPARLICPLPYADGILADGDSDAASEDAIAAALAEMQPESVIADPLYRFILPKQAKHIRLPHYAFSGRCFETQIPDLTAARFDAWLNAQILEKHKEDRP